MLQKSEVRASRNMLLALLMARFCCIHDCSRAQIMSEYFVQRLLLEDKNEIEVKSNLQLVSSDYFKARRQNLEMFRDYFQFDITIIDSMYLRVFIYEMVLGFHL